jgi:uncharacterized protein with HEPN domain
MSTAAREAKLITDAIAAIDTALEFMGPSDLKAYLSNRMLRSAVERQLEILGEACSQLDKLSTAWREKLPDLKLAIGLRNRIIHVYDGIDHDVVFETIQLDLPSLRNSLAALAPSAP